VNLKEKVICHGRNLSLASLKRLSLEVIFDGRNVLSDWDFKICFPSINGIESDIWSVVRKRLSLRGTIKKSNAILPPQ